MRASDCRASSVAFVDGGSAVTPARTSPAHPSPSPAGRPTPQLLHQTLGDEGILVLQMIIHGVIVAGDLQKDPEILAAHLWDLHAKRDRFRYTVGERPLPATVGVVPSTAAWASISPSRGASFMRLSP